MKIKAVKLAQAQAFEKRTENYFTIITVPGRPKISIEFIKDLGMIDIKSSLDHIMIPLSNIGGIYMWTEKDSAHEEFKEAEKNKEFGTKPSKIKRPK